LLRYKKQQLSPHTGEQPGRKGGQTPKVAVNINQQAKLAPAGAAGDKIITTKNYDMPAKHRTRLDFTALWLRRK
jgi:hypothetical protein